MFERRGGIRDRCLRKGCDVDGKNSLKFVDQEKLMIVELGALLDLPSDCPKMLT